MTGSGHDLRSSVGFAANDAAIELSSIAKASSGAEDVGAARHAGTKGSVV